MWNKLKSLLKNRSNRESLDFFLLRIGEKKFTFYNCKRRIFTSQTTNLTSQIKRINDIIKSKQNEEGKSQK